MATKTRLLFVDDDDAIRLTLPMLLQEKGYQVEVAASVKEGLEKINSQPFEVLLTDLNIGQPGDGFTLISAMRRVQPHAINIIITGYPDFDSALNAIRRQVDGYIVKPSDIDSLVQNIEERLASRTPQLPASPTKSVAQIIDEHRQEIIQNWLKMVREDPEIATAPLSDADCTGHLLAVLSDMIEMLNAPSATTSPARMDTVRKHGEIRRKQNYSVPHIIEETRLLERSIFSVLHANLLSANFSNLIPDIIRISDTLQIQLKASVEAYLNAGKKRKPSSA
jgi:ActR/RegA family two-component response regulator